MGFRPMCMCQSPDPCTCTHVHDTVEVYKHNVVCWVATRSLHNTTHAQLHIFIQPQVALTTRTAVSNEGDTHPLPVVKTST